VLAAFYGASSAPQDLTLIQSNGSNGVDIASDPNNAAVGIGGASTASITLGANGGNPTIQLPPAFSGGGTQALTTNNSGVLGVGGSINTTNGSAAAGSTKSLSQSGFQMWDYDSTGAQVTFELPTSPNDGDWVCMKAIGTTYADPAAVTARGGASVEQYSAPGTFTSANGSTNIPAVPGISSWLKYNAASTRWEAVLL
jgi:hypothetical protein